MNLFQRYSVNNITKTNLQKNAQEVSVIEANKSTTEKYERLQQEVNTLSNEFSKLRELIEDFITRPDNIIDNQPNINTEVGNQLFANDSARPPKPELTGDIKRLWWMLSKIQNRFSWVRISSHINQQYYKNYKQKFVHYKTLRSFTTTTNAKWSNDSQQWGGHIAVDRCAKALPFAYELLTSAEQYKYDEMFGKPKVIK